MYGRKQISLGVILIILSVIAFLAVLFGAMLASGHTVFARNLVLFSLLIGAAVFMSFRNS